MEFTRPPRWLCSTACSREVWRLSCLQRPCLCWKDLCTFVKAGRTITLSRLLRRLLFTLGCPPRYQLMASNTFYGLQIWTDSNFPPSSSNHSLRFSSFICSCFITNAFPCVLFLTENWLPNSYQMRRQVLQMPRTSCKGHMACFLVLFGYQPLSTKVYSFHTVGVGGFGGIRYKELVVSLGT